MNTELDPTAVAERVLQLLDDSATTATYKYAVLLGILELCVEGAQQRGVEPESLTTRQLAEKVVELYWPHTQDWAENDLRLLRQNTTRGREIATMVAEFRASLELASDRSAPWFMASRQDQQGWSALLDEVEWKLIEMPIPRLQRIQGNDVAWLYRIEWIDEDGARRDGRPKVKVGEVRRYQRGLPGSSFDNLIRLLPGVSAALVRLHVLLRPFIEQKWVRMVATINRLPERRLPEFLFGFDRKDLGPVRPGLSALQKGVCFYCDSKLRSGDKAEVHVDHFLPWSRYANNGLANLVAAHKACNQAKSDFLAAERHVRRWRQHLDVHEAALRQLADDVSWQVESERVLGAARSLYVGLPPEARLWDAASGLQEVRDTNFAAFL